LKAFTKTQTEQIAKLYNALGNSGLDLIADVFGRSRASIVNKLVDMKIYVVPDERLERIERQIRSISEQLNAINRDG
jgi:putative heme iron utilization protein